MTLAQCIAYIETRRGAGLHIKHEHKKFDFTFGRFDEALKVKYNDIETISFPIDDNWYIENKYNRYPPDEVIGNNKLLAMDTVRELHAQIQSMTKERNTLLRTLAKELANDFSETLGYFPIGVYDIDIETNTIIFMENVPDVTKLKQQRVISYDKWVLKLYYDGISSYATYDRKELKSWLKDIIRTYIDKDATNK